MSGGEFAGGLGAGPDDGPVTKGEALALLIGISCVLIVSCR